MGSTLLDSQAGEKGVGSNTQPLSDAFLNEFGKKPIEKASVHSSSSTFARIVDNHFDELANLADRRDGFPISLRFSATPRTVSYNDLKEMEKLADSRLGLQNHYSKEYIDGMQSSQVGWAKVGGIGCGAVAGGILRYALPILRGRGGAAVTAGMMALGAVAGYEVGGFLGQKSFDNLASNSTYLSMETTKYGESLGRAWQQNAKLAGGAGIVGGVAAFAFLGTPRVAIGLGVAGIVTCLGSPLAYQLGYRSAAKELERDAELGRRIEREWQAAAH